MIDDLCTTDARDALNAPATFDDAHHLLVAAIEELARAQRETGLWLARSVGHPRATMSIVRMLARTGPQQIGCIANLLRVDMSVASRQVSVLVDAGYVERVIDEDDRRARTVQLTDAGRALAADSRRLIVQAAHRTFAGWDPEEIALAATQLRKVAASIAGSFDHEADATRAPGTELLTAASG